MSKINELKYEGRVAGEIKSRTFGSGKTVHEWGMSVYAGKDASGAYKNAFISVKHWGNSAPIKGQDITVIGRLGAEVWTKDGRDTSKITVICESFSVVGSDSSDHASAHQQAKQNGYAPQDSRGDTTDDLPF